MSDVPSWSDLRTALNGNQDEHVLNEKLFARLEGWSWPLYGAAEAEFKAEYPARDYLGHMESAAAAVIGMFRCVLWDAEDYEPGIGLELKDGVWTAKVEIDAAHAAAASDGAMRSGLAMAAQDPRPGAAIMKAAVEIRHVLQLAREAAETPEP